MKVSERGGQVKRFSVRKVAKDRSKLQSEKLGDLQFSSFFGLTD
jgi:hypothetical protein